MRYFLIASHGMLSEGFLSALNLIAGEMTNVSIVNAYLENTALEVLTEPFFSKLEKDDEAIVFTDLVGGSVNRFFLKYLNRPHFHIISGANLALIIGLLFIPKEGYLTTERIEEELELARGQLVYMNQYVKTFSFENNFEE